MSKGIARLTAAAITAGLVLLWVAVTSVTLAASAILGFSLPNATAGSPYLAKVDLQAAGLSGCYNISASKLPYGLAAGPSRVCTQGNSSGLKITIIGVLPPRSYQVSTTATVVITAKPTKGHRAPLTWGTNIGVLPAPYAVSSRNAKSVLVANSGLVLDQVSCPEALNCFVTGVSSNPPLPGATNAKGVFLEHAASPFGGKANLVPGGEFIAQLVTIPGARLHILDDIVPESIKALSCPSTSECVLAGSAPDGWPWIGALNTSTGAIEGSTFSFSERRYTAGSLVSLSCPSTTACVVVGSLQLKAPRPNNQTTVALAGNIAVGGSAPSATSWSEFFQGAGLNSVSCGSTSDCEAVGNGGPNQNASADLILNSSNGGTSWTRIQTVGCLSPVGKCKAVQEPFWNSIDGPITFGDLSYNQCVPGSGFHCTVEWQAFQQFASTTNGRDWVTGTMADPLNIASLGAERGFPGIAAMSCARDGHCFSVADTVTASIGGTQTYVSILESVSVGGKTEWGLAGHANLPNNENLNLVSISCPTRTSCVAVGGYTPPFGPHGTQVTEPFVMSADFALHPLIGAVPNLLGVLAPFAGLALAGAAVVLMLTGVGELTIGGLAIFRIVGIASELISVLGLLQGHDDLLSLLGVALGAVSVFGSPAGVIDVITLAINWFQQFLGLTNRLGS